MEPRERELRELLTRARLTLAFDDQPASPAAQVGIDTASLHAIAERAAARAVQLYAETHPRPTQVTQRQVAEMLGVTARTVQNYISTGKLKLNGCGRVPIEAVDKIRAAD